MSLVRAAPEQLNLKEVMVTVIYSICVCVWV